MAEYSDKKYNRSLKNPTIEGSTGLVLPTGTTTGATGRPGSPTEGLIRYNTTTGLAEVYSSIGYVSIDSPPSISTFSGLINENQNTTITVTGTNFQVGAVISINGAGVNNTKRDLSTTRVSSSTLTANTAAASVNYEGGENFDVTVTNTSGLSNTLSSAGTVDGVPIWSTAAGSLGSAFLGASASFSTTATDPNSDVITYSLVSGSLPTGLSLNSSTGAITGTVSGSAGTFTLRASSTQASTVSNSDRAFSIVITEIATGGTITNYSSGGNNYKIHAFLSGTGDFVLNTSKALDVLIVAGGGGGGRAYGDNDTGKGGGGAGQALFRTGYSPGVGTYSIVVGAGGPGYTNGNNTTPPAPSSAGNSSGFGVTSNGGGYGGASDNHYGPQVGGSGGGAGARNGNAFDNGVGSNKTSPAGWTSYGNSGGNSASGNFGGGGGGGAGGSGQNYQGSTNASRGGDGGIGIDLSSTFGTGYGSPGGWFAGGGGGGSYYHTSNPGQSNVITGGYFGGGGRGALTQEHSYGNAFNVDNQDGVANTGGGGGGAGEDAALIPNGGSRSGAGGSGIVLIRYQI